MRLALLSLLAHAACSCSGPVPLAPRDPTEGAAHLEVMTFNVHRDRWNDKATVEAVGGPDADVVCLQEPTASWERVLRARYAAQYPYMLFLPRDDAGGLGFMSRFPLEDHGVLDAPDGWHPAWHVVVQTPDGPVQILQVHLRAIFDAGPNLIASYIDTGSDHVLELERFMQRRMDGMPLIVLGDFNENERSDTLRWLEGRGLTNALPLFHPGQFTWKTASLAGGFDMTIDHILFDESLEILDAHVARQGHSDHLPIVADVEWLRPLL